MKETLHVYRNIVGNGVEIRLKKRSYHVRYPAAVWKKFPKALHRPFADALAYATTWHLPFMNGNKMIYHFTHPVLETIFSKMLFYALPMNIFETEGARTSEVLKTFYNAAFETQFEGLNFSPPSKKVTRHLKNKALLLFSFGKESLLTYGLLKELKVPVAPFYIQEPHSLTENRHKRALANSFSKKLGEEILFFQLDIGKLREGDGYCWGWDIILSQYALVLIPYFFSHQAKYLFLGNEQSCNFYTTDSEGYLVNPVYEQSVAAMQLLQSVPKLFSINTHIGSLVEPVHEMLITYMLHRRYPAVGQYQMSCFSYEDGVKKKARWCGNCEKCARLYLYFRALEIDPLRIGFTHTNMFDRGKRALYPLLNEKNTKSSYGGSGLGKDEQLLAFYLAYKNGAKGELINEFKRRFLKDATKRRKKLIEEYFGIHSSYTLPSDLRAKTLAVFKKEQRHALKYINALL